MTLNGAGTTEPDADAVVYDVGATLAVAQNAAVDQIGQGQALPLHGDNATNVGVLDVTKSEEKDRPPASP